jgi:hypothetical protein
VPACDNQSDTIQVIRRGNTELCDGIGFVAQADRL